LGTKGQHATSRPPKPLNKKINYLYRHYITSYFVQNSKQTLHKILKNKVLYEAGWLRPMVSLRLIGFFIDVISPAAVWLIDRLSL
jgi:hypothetical protein